ncbi:MAG: DsrE family protein, partial [Caldisphaera sp.]
MDSIKLVMHISNDSQESLKNLFSSIYSVLDTVKQSRVEVVITDRGVINFLKGNVDKYTYETIMELIGSGVKFNACNISLRSLGISSKDLIEGLNNVESGIIKIIELVNNGYVYIKP